MRSKTRAILVGIVSFVAFSAAATSASALTVTPNGAGSPYSAASGTATLTASSIGQTLTCSSSSFSGIVLAADGTGSIPLGNAVYSGCRNALLGAFTVAQTSAWSIATVLTAGSPASVGLRVSLPAAGVRITSTSAGCSFTVTGSVVLSTTVSGLPAAISGAPVTSSSLRIDGNTGGICAAFAVNLAVAYSASYTLNQTATVSG